MPSRKPVIRSLEDLGSAVDPKVETPSETNDPVHVEPQSVEFVTAADADSEPENAEPEIEAAQPDAPEDELRNDDHYELWGVLNKDASHVFLEDVVILGDAKSDASVIELVGNYSKSDMYQDLVFVSKAYGSATPIKEMLQTGMLQVPTVPAYEIWAISKEPEGEKVFLQDVWSLDNVDGNDTNIPIAQYLQDYRNDGLYKTVFVQEKDSGKRVLIVETNSVTSMDVPIEKLEDETADSEPEKDTVLRRELIDKLLEYDSGDNADRLRAVYTRLPDDRLRDMLSLLEAEWGGSPLGRIAYADIEKRFQALSTSPVVKARKSLLAAKYKDYHKLAQKIDKALGKDTLIGAMKHTEYHRMLNTLIEHHSVLAHGIREMADMVSMPLPEETPEEVLVPLDTEHLLRILLSVGISAKTWLLASNELRGQIDKLEAQNAQQVTQIKNAYKGRDEAISRLALKEEEIRRSKHSRFGVKYAIVNEDGEFLALTEDAKSINPRMLEWSEDFEEALLMTTEEKIRKVFDAMRRWAHPKSKYSRLMQRNGMHPRDLDVVAVTLERL